MAKVIVGMSGGVDSAVTAYLLKLAGHEVVGVTLRTWLSADGKESRCCEIDDARKISWQLDIPYYVINCINDFKEKVVDPFAMENIEGLTPNPCVWCNKEIKWSKMIESLDVFGADYIATGHYANIKELENGRVTLQQADCIEKDQTYMLYKLTQEQLKKTMMPLGKINKKEVRKIAESINLEVANKPDSQEICFVTEGKYGEYIENNYDFPLPEEGYFVDEKGNKLGKHRGIIHYTIGQRKGLGISLGERTYVKEIRKETNEVVLSGNDALFSKQIKCNQINFMSIEDLKEGEELEANVKVRYHHNPQKAIIRRTNEDELTIDFYENIRAAAPGQSAVIYDDDNCIIGGGIIVK
ncbi:tRNA 2-thiouridine(34) synthase MnmA [Lachnobacterium bovis]|uniref:tRNA 2-thiouridine(34) synthase MnmA n=1 Tax=Lachnobacterium bovis TaxID=140626 RepID=UPI0003B38E27|nr:tRNA 2-thiouridine(34) synthase MnmA [Lachnobacterium bovis]